MSTLTLRGEVEALAHDLAKNPQFWTGELFDIAKRLRAILSRHADEVSVPRELLADFRKVANWAADRTLYDDVGERYREMVEQADAILKDPTNAQ